MRRSGHVYESVMARRTVHEFLAAYSCCYAMATLLLLQLAANMVVVGMASGGPLGSAAADTVEVVPIPSFAARNKRWTTFFGGVLVTEKGKVPVQNCITDTDCLKTAFTSCGIDPIDKKRKCLCADGKQPFDGDCLRKPSDNNAVQNCTTDSDCLDTAYIFCGIDPIDEKRKCLCSDGKPPFDGNCLRKPSDNT